MLHKMVSSINSSIEAFEIVLMLGMMTKLGMGATSKSWLFEQEVIIVLVVLS
jgi:hypothetical protein